MVRMDKKGSITARTLEKLGLNSFRLRSNSQPTRPSDLEKDRDDSGSDSNAERSRSNTLEKISPSPSHDNIKQPSQEQKKSLKERLWNYYHKNEGKRSKKLRKKKLSLDETGRYRKDDEKKSGTVFYVDHSEETMVSKDKNGDKRASGEKSINVMTPERRKKSIPPPGTTEYTVKDRETIESIAAHFDTTPSELKKVNRLITSMIFSGQVIYIPDKNYVPVRSSTSSTSSEPIDIGSKSPRGTPVGSPETRPTMDIPLVKAANKPPSVIPGHAERSPTEESEFEMIQRPPPSKLSEDEVQQLDQDCMERFIKLKVKHITDGQGVVKGTLLVTPNAVMFDPDVLDPLVVEHGSEKYGMIAPMDMIISAAMYHDIAVMKLRGKKQPDGTMFPKPEVYHDKSCPLYKARKGSKEILETEDNDADKDDDKISDLKNLAETKRKAYGNKKSDSVCSCGGIDSQQKTPDSDKGSDSDRLGRNSEEANDRDLKTEDTSVKEKPLIDLGESELHSTECDKISVDFDSLDIIPDLEKASSPKSSDTKTVAFSIDDYDISGIKDSNSPSEDVFKGDQFLEKSSFKSSNKTEPPTSSDKGDNDLMSNDKDSEDKKLQIGNIVYLPVEDSQGQVTLKSLEETQNALSKLSTEAFEQTSKSETNLTGNVPKSENQDIEKKRSASSSSLGPFSPSPHLSAFVNYATGFFSRTESQKEIKDINEVTEEPKFEEPKKTSDIPVIAAAPTVAGKRRGKISRHGNSNKGIEVESAVKMNEKIEDLFSVDYDKFKPRQSVAYSDPPLYLCLRLGMPQNKVFHNYTIESYGKRRKKSEYWFSIPREKVDHLYAFFVQWTPEIYGDQEDIDPEKRGFVVIPDNADGDDEESLEVLDEYFGQNSVLYKDWEIISKIEALKRRSIVIEEPLPLPELHGQSTILDDALIFQLSQVIPPRTVGYPWTLIYSTDKHGFSLKTLYRDMHGLDTPVLLVVKDTQDHVFGALTSCEIKISDHFYGTGETFLFTFYPDFQVYNWSGDNNFFIKGNKESLSIGAGKGVFGLWFDEDLYHGRTHKCETFNNDLLTSSEDFVVKALEAWAFVQD